jgi:hypothetical protein
MSNRHGESSGEAKRMRKTAAQAGLPPALVTLHRQLLRIFLTSGGPPRAAELRRLADGLGLAPGEAMQRLADADLVHTDPVTGAATTAYPFSGVSTPHVVRVDGVPMLYAMCAIDALGIPLMVGQDAVITSVSPATRDTITVERRAGTWLWQPATAVIVTVGIKSAGPSLSCTCPFITFHATVEHAVAYLQHGAPAGGRIVGQSEAVDAAEAEFGRLLSG